MYLRGGRPARMLPIATIGEEAGVKIFPAMLALEIRIDAGKGSKHAWVPFSRTLGLHALTPATYRPELDARKGFGSELSPSGLADLSRRDGGDSVGPMERLIEIKAPALELEQSFSSLFDALIIEHPGTGQVPASAVDFIVGKRRVLDDYGDASRRHNPSSLLCYVATSGRVCDVDDNDGGVAIAAGRCRRIGRGDSR